LAFVLEKKFTHAENSSIFGQGYPPPAGPGAEHCFSANAWLGPGSGGGMVISTRVPQAVIYFPEARGTAPRQSASAEALR